MGRCLDLSSKLHRICVRVVAPCAPFSPSLLSCLNRVQVRNWEPL
ncbi:MTS domain-containing protein [Psidium guajava]|nr:MTS domain-containing protein [Psidium guajava]